MSRQPKPRPSPPMQQSEKMVWAAAFVSAIERTRAVLRDLHSQGHAKDRDMLDSDTIADASEWASFVVQSMREHYPTVKDGYGGLKESEVTYMLNQMLSSPR